MTANWTFGKRLAISFGVAATTLLLVAVLAFWSASGLIENNREVSHTLQVRAELSDLQRMMQEAESAQRGFVLSGSENFLPPYDRALRDVGPQLDGLRTLTADNPRQQGRLAQLAPIIQTRLDIMRDTIATRRSEGLAAAAARTATQSGKEVMDRIRAILADADREEATLLAERTSTAEARANLAIAAIVVSGIIGALVVGVIGVLMVRLLSTQIGAAVGHMQSSSSELQAAANQQAAGIREQVASMTEISTTISELLATSHQIAESAQRVAQIADQTTSTARAGDGAVTTAAESISGIRRQMDLVVGQMLELGQKSQQIGAILDIVTELAEQTNILSINATIEAAGAGEGGRRFAVVADEIRKLADRVSGSAKEIRQLIEDVRTSVNTTIMSTETGSKAVDSGAKQFGQVTEVFDQISSVASTTAEAAREIELSTKQQATAVEQVNIAIANIAQATQETEASTGQTIQTASELASTSLNLLRLVRAEAA